MKIQIALFALAAGSASALQGTWEQCGGQAWTGGTVCTAGNVCVFQNPWYSQCLPAPSSSTWRAVAGPVSTPASSSTLAPVLSRKKTTTAKVVVTTSTTTPKPTSTTSTTTPKPTSTTSTTTSPKPSSTSPSSGVGVTYKASFTQYGAGDTFGSPNCNTNTCACAFFTNPGFAVAISQNLYGVGPGAGAGPGCGTCWKIVGETDSSGNKLSNAGTSIVVMANNLCPAQGNPLCSQATLKDTNQYGANVNFDLCSDSGAAAAFFPSGVGLAVGTVTQVDCSQWSGTIVH